MAGENVINRTQSLTGGGVTVGGVTEAATADNVNVFKKTIPANSTNARIDFPITLDTLIAIGIVANKDVTVKTNSTSSPADTLTLAANKPLIYVASDPDDNLFLSADVTSLYVTTGAAATEVKIVAGVNSTPVLSD